MKPEVDFTTDDAARLTAFLEDPQRPDGTLTYHQLSGFLFAVANAPDLAMPSEWREQIFNEQDPGFQSIDEVNEIMDLIARLYNGMLRELPPEGEGGFLPLGCVVHEDAMRNLEPGAPLNRWAEGFRLGYEWMQESWEWALQSGEEDDEEEDGFGVILLPLLFFSSRAVAEAFAAEGSGEDTSVESLAETCLTLLPGVAGEFAHIGRSYWPAARERGPEPFRHDSPPPGRNDPCPCGSGWKYKRCCGARLN